jgi:tetratricopeptide (TPR) repeat protein
VHGTRSPLWFALAAWLLAAGHPCVALSALEVADPLEVPRGAEPSLSPGLETPEARLDHAIGGFRARGYRELPVLAEAVLEVGGGNAPARALELAPSIPAVRFAVAREQMNPLELARSFRLLFTNFPSLVWLGTWSGAALGLAILASVAVLVVVGFARTIEIHGHQIGHLNVDRDPPAWPGVLLVASGLAVLPLAGVGPALVLALGGALTALRLPRSQGVRIGLGLILVSLLLGPAVDFWSRLATLPGRDPAALAAWRIERQQPLPGDRSRLMLAIASHPDDPGLHLLGATAWKQAGELERAERALAEMPVASSAGIEARRQNLRGILLLARGRVREATEAFEAAAAAEPSAAVFYNLSQAHGRALRLIEQGNLFAAARDLDPRLVSRYTEFRDANVHTYLIQDPLPLATYLGWAFAPSPEASRLAREIRDRLVGPALPGFTWQLVGVLGLVSLLFRHAGIRRCTRCLRVICGRCSPELASAAKTCARCAHLFSQSETVDARIRKREVERDRRRVRGTARGLAALGLVAPGSARIFEGRIGPGWLHFLLAASGLCLLLVRNVAALPAEVGQLGAALPRFAALVLLLPCYLLAANESLRRLRAARRVS